MFKLEADLAPFQDSTGFEGECFQNWWTRVESRLSKVPAEVAESWIHRHWYGATLEIDPTAYEYEVVTMSANKILGLRSLRLDFSGELADYLEDAEMLLDIDHGYCGYDLAELMVRAKLFPARPIILDNRDVHRVDFRTITGSVVNEHVLIEGNKRLSLAKLLIGQGRFSEKAEFWQMSVRK